MELDFDTSDVESGVHILSKGHSRSWSDDADIPLIRVGPKQWTSSPSKASFDSDIQSVSTYAFPTRNRSLSLESGTLQHALDSVPYASATPPDQFPIPIIKEPSPPPKPTTSESEPPAADHHLGKLVARPSFLTRPRPAPRPGAASSRSRGGADMRSALLNRLASTRLRRDPSDEGDAEGDSPSSVYSQSSSLPHGFHEQPFPADDAPPVPPIPSQFQIQLSDVFGDSTFTSAHPAGDRPVSALPLEESIAFPLPNFPDHDTLPVPLKSPNSKLFPGLWANSPSSTSPSPSHSPSDRPPMTPTDGGVITMRSTEVQSGVPQYNIVEAESMGQKGMVGYQLPLNWRSSQSSTTMSMPIPSTADAATPVGFAY